MNDCGKTAKCVELEASYKCISDCERAGNCVGGQCAKDNVGGKLGVNFRQNFEKFYEILAPKFRANFVPASRDL